MRLTDSKLYSSDLEYAVSDDALRFLRNKTVLLTGGTGLIGSAIVDLMMASNEHNATNIAIIVASRTEEGVIKRFGKNDHIIWEKYDALEPIMITNKADYIIHCAGNASPELYDSKAVETMNMNYIALNSLLNYAKEEKVEGILYLSSSEVYGIKNSESAFKESDYGYLDLLLPRSSYASSKRAAETLCCAYAEEYGIRTLIARPGHVFGPTASMKDRRVSSAFAYDAAAGKALTLKSSGCQRRSYIYCLDCAKAILKILEKGQTGNAYNVCGEENVTIREMAAFLAEAGNVELIYTEPSAEELARFNPMNNSSLSFDKIHQLGFTPMFSIKQGLFHTVRIIQQIIQ